MSLFNASLLSGGTVSTSGGTALAFESRGSTIDKVRLVASADEDLRTRREIICSVSDPKVLATAPNGYTQARSSVTIKLPLELDNGNLTHITFNGTVSMDVEATLAEKQELMCLVAQVYSDADFADFLTKQLIA